MLLKVTKEEYSWLGRRLGRLTQALQGRSREHVKLIKETAAKFGGERAVDAEGNVSIPVQRRHLRLLEEIQRVSIQALEQGTLQEINNRIANGKSENGYYEAKRDEAAKLLAETKELLAKIERHL